MNPDLFAALASIINDVDTGVRKQSGTRIGNQATGQIIYSPPVGEDLIRGLLTNLCEFIYDDQDDIDPLVKLAVAHYQFEAIHPFPDGNGRTGRVLNILFLIERRLLEIPVLYLSRYIIQNKSRYYHGLREVTEHGAWEDWISLILQAIEATAIETRKRIHSIRQAMTEAKELIKVAAPKMYSHELVELIFSQPYTRIGFLEQSGLAKRQTASVYLKRLEELGILVSVKSWRETLYLNPKLMQLLAA